MLIADMHFFEQLALENITAGMSAPILVTQQQVNKKM
jgi:hypothetical protein